MHDYQSTRDARSYVHLTSRLAAVLAASLLLMVPLLAPPAANAGVLDGEALGVKIMKTFAGTGEAGFSGDGGPATDAELNRPTNVAVDSKGNTYISDIRNHRVRKVAPDGTITTVAGTGERGFSGDGGQAADAQLNWPRGLAFDDEGNLYIADSVNARIRKVDASTGTITTVAGEGTLAYGGDGGPAIDASLFLPADVGFDGEGNLHIVGLLSNRVRKVEASTGTISTVAGNGDRGFSGDGGPATEAQLNQPMGLAVAADGTFFVADRRNQRIRRVNTAGTISTFAGGGDHGGTVLEDIPATEAELDTPHDVALGSDGVVYITDTRNHVVRKVDESGTITTFAGGGDSDDGLGDNLAPTEADLRDPHGLAIDEGLGLLIADRGHHRVRQVTRVPDLVAVSLNPPNELQVGQEGDYTAMVTNNGLAGRATGVQLQVSLQDTEVVSTEPSQGTCSASGGQVSCQLGELAEGATATVNLTASPTVAQVAEHSASASAGNEDPYPRNNSTTVKSVVADKGCGQTITEDTTLSEDIGPCPANGLQVGADGVTVDLNGHSVIGFRGYQGYGFPDYNPVYEHDARNAAFGLLGTGREAGVLVSGRQDVTVQGGTITGFSGGVVLNQGANNNTIRNLELVDIVGPYIKPGGPFPPLGDGIVLFNSPDNVIADNTLTRSGWWDAIGLWGPGSDNNEVTGNTVNGTPSIGDNELAIGIITNGADMHQGKITGTTVANNVVRDAGAHGISNFNSFDARVANNLVVNSGRNNPAGRGIAVSSGEQLSTADTNMTIVGNTVRNNTLDGIHVNSRGNTIINNTSLDNGQAGDGSFAGELWFDLADHTASDTCEYNTWNNNRWGSAAYFPECTSKKGLGKGRNPARNANPEPVEPSQLPMRQPPDFANNGG